jgi:hypothetical protein
MPCRVTLGRVFFTPIAEILADRGLPFIFVSGYGSEGRPTAFRDRPGLRKPFLIESLAAIIEKVLGEQSNGTSSLPGLPKMIKMLK